MKIIGLVILAGLSSFAFNASAASFSEAKVTEIVKDVSLLRPPSHVARASIGDKVAGSTTVRTGIKSRTELTFPDDSLLRLGSNTQFSFATGNRDFNLTRGTAVLKTTKSSGGARIHAGAVTAAITGSMAAVLKPPPGEAGFFKLLLFFGTASAIIDGKEYPLKPWQLLVVPVDENGEAAGKPKIVYFDAALCAQTSNLMNPEEEGLKENLERFKAALEAGEFDVRPNISQSAPVPGANQEGEASENVLKKLFGLFRRPPGEVSPPPSPPPATGPVCPEGFYFDSDFQECFPGACPEGSAFDHVLQRCVPSGEGASPQ